MSDRTEDIDRAVSPYTTGVYSQAAEPDMQTELHMLRALNAHYTAIHPSVQWKFEEALQTVDAGNGVHDEIIFPQVWPLYAQADIMESSVMRNRAVQQDLRAQFDLAEFILEGYVQDSPLLLLPFVVKELRRLKHLVSSRMDAQTEFMVRRFFAHEVQPIFREFAQKEGRSDHTLQEYLGMVGDDGLFDHAYKDYEESVSMINEMIMRVVSEREAVAQAIVPHIFQTNTTDGLAFQIYAGQSILQDQMFHPMHIDNLILWQLVTLCEVTRAVHFIRDQLPVALQTAQLILAYHTPVCLAYRDDIKQFAVSNGRHIHYEILKKRIEKSRVAGTGQRLTQSDRIAIVYALDVEREAYLTQLEHLQSEQWLADDIEDLRLEPMQGVHGLRALRFRVST